MQPLHNGTVMEKQQTGPSFPGAWLVSAIHDFTIIV